MTRLIQIIIVLAAFALFGWTFWLNLAPSGVLEARYDFNRPSPFITSLLPGGRALPIARNESGKFYQGIIGDPVYFRLQSPRSFDRAILSVTFQNPDHPVLEVGGLASRDPDNYDLKSLENRIIDELDWPAMHYNDLTLYQRYPRYDTVNAFLESPSPRNEIATYHAPLEVPFRLPGYSPTAAVHTIDASLRGAHTFYAYVKNETLEVTFWVQDMDRASGGDPITVTVYRGSDPIGTVSDADNARVNDGRPYPIHLAIPGLPEGAYRLEFRASRDVFIRKIETRSKKFVAQDKVFLGDEAGYRDYDRPVTLWTTGRLLRAQTLHDDGTQELVVGEAVVRVAESHREYAHRITGVPPVRLYSPQGDIELRANGFFAFSPEALFVPEPVRLVWDTDIDAEGINYILAEYAPPREENGWKKATATFDLTKLRVEDRAIPFVISAPGITELQNEVRLGEIAVRFEREPQSLRDLLSIMLNEVKNCSIKPVSNSRE